MSEHIPEPWRVEVNRDDPGDVYVRILGADDDTVQYGFALPDARRIVACVNYCEGVQTLEIESAPKHLQLRGLLDMIDNLDKPKAKAGK